MMTTYGVEANYAGHEALLVPAKVGEQHAHLGSEGRVIRQQRPRLAQIPGPGAVRERELLNVPGERISCKNGRPDGRFLFAWSTKTVLVCGHFDGCRVPHAQQGHSTRAIQRPMKHLASSARRRVRTGRGIDVAATVYVSGVVQSRPLIRCVQKTDKSRRHSSRCTATRAVPAHGREPADVLAVAGRQQGRVGRRGAQERHRIGQEVLQNRILLAGERVSVWCARVTRHSEAAEARQGLCQIGPQINDPK
jgi:hypothetical protein